MPKDISGPRRGFVLSRVSCVSLSPPPHIFPHRDQKAKTEDAFRARGDADLVERQGAMRPLLEAGMRSLATMIRLLS